MSEHPLATPDGDENNSHPSDAVKPLPEPERQVSQAPAVREISTDTKKKEWIRSRMLWCPVAIIVVIMLGIPLGFGYRIRDFSIPDTSDNSTIQLEALLVDIDPHMKTMTIDWQVDNATCSSQPCEIYDIFFDNSLLVSGSRNNEQSSANNSIPRTPIFSVDSGLMNPELNIFANTAFFTTEVSLVPARGDEGKERSLQSYPFDRYSAGIFVFAKNRNDSSDDPNRHVPISVSQSGGIAAGFKTNVNTISLDKTSILLAIDISRGIEVRIYAVVIVFAIWLVTLVLLSATMSSVFLGHKIAKEVLLVPVATLFAFTSLRGTLPGAPEGFGAIMDYIGILPCLSILTFRSVLHLGIFLFRNPENNRADVAARI